MKHTDKVALVTGASRGIGKAIALRLASEGAYVVLVYKEKQKEAQEVVHQIGTDRAVAYKTDLTKEPEVKQLVQDIKDRYGHVDILVNNAGTIIHPGDWHCDLQTWHETLDANLTSAWLMIREVVPLMTRSGSAIVNITSIYGSLGAAPVLPYTSAKGGLITLTKSFAKELAPHIRVNGVSPSNVYTDMLKGADDELIAHFKSQTPLGRIADPDEIAKVVSFLASDDASYITGQIVNVDGGYGLK